MDILQTVETRVEDLLKTPEGQRSLATYLHWYTGGNYVQLFLRHTPPTINKDDPKAPLNTLGIPHGLQTDDLARLLAKQIANELIERAHKGDGSKGLDREALAILTRG